MGFTCKKTTGKMRGMMKRVENEQLKEKQAEKNKKKGRNNSDEKS